MPTNLDRALNSKAAFWGFASVITAASLWTIWGQDSLFPREADPTGDPQTWSIEQLRTWLNNRYLLPSSTATKEQLLERVRNNMRNGR
ncbi:hypothetical protein EJ06DRAFT_502803 [Trichodelitschia bisporula]|uniref:STE24 endopeptidase n=1 Tax=Trichodelitschia bisporula TaxID=703511 RepID=A0A6G1IBR5_9PEZI|nr:hypothetical protein EJ06DRAFT_502803 [Trichodelitschia bisporula]